MSKGTVKNLQDRIENLTKDVDNSFQNTVEAFQLMRLRNDLLTNGYQPPIPRKNKNQRQRRLHNRRNPHSIK